MTNYKVITNSDDTASSNVSSTTNTSNTENPAENRKRHKPTKGLPRI